MLILNRYCDILEKLTRLDKEIRYTDLGINAGKTTGMRMNCKNKEVVNKMKNHLYTLEQRYMRQGRLKTSTTRKSNIRAALLYLSEM